MTKFCLIPILLTFFVTPVDAKVVPGGGIVAATAAIGVTPRNGELSSQFQSDCAGCHREIFPFKAPETCLLKLPCLKTEDSLWPSEGSSRGQGRLNVTHLNKVFAADLFPVPLCSRNSDS